MTDPKELCEGLRTAAGGARLNHLSAIADITDEAAAAIESLLARAEELDNQRIGSDMFAKCCMEERDAALARVEELERKDENWHRWLSEVLTDWRVEFDHHTIGVRHALACFLADQQAGKQAALARVKAMRPYLQHAEWCGTPAYGQMLVSNRIVHGNRLPVGGQGSCVEFNYERICTCGLDAAINQERPGTGTA